MVRFTAVRIGIGLEYDRNHRPAKPPAVDKPSPSVIPDYDNLKSAKPSEKNNDSI